ncbi:MAG: hypothetical protein AAF533_29985 [Acidobacteriota bacterium]
MKHLTLAAALLLGTTTLTTAQDRADRSTWLYDHSETREGALGLDGIARVRILSHGDELQVHGLTHVDELSFVGTAWARRVQDLADVRISAYRTGNVLTLETHQPPSHQVDTRLTLRVELPDSLVVDIEDGPGSLNVKQVRRLQVDDGAGPLSIEGVAEDLVVEDGSGPVTLREIHGSVELTDGLGDLDVQDVGGDLELHDGQGAVRVADVDGHVNVQDGSGAIDVDRVHGNVRVRADGAGDIAVEHVRGNLVIEDDRSGRLTYGNVDGNLQLPGDHLELADAESLQES